MLPPCCCSLCWSDSIPGDCLRGFPLIARGRYGWCSPQFLPTPEVMSESNDADVTIPVLRKGIPWACSCWSPICWQSSMDNGLPLHSEGVHSLDNECVFVLTGDSVSNAMCFITRLLPQGYPRRCASVK
ncbi:hypothetical protein FKM82_022494 [Ascaphus truei]